MATGVEEVVGHSSNPRYSVMDLGRHYNRERHISLGDAEKLVREHAPHLDPDLLNKAVSNEEVRTYRFRNEGEEYVDRLDIGRVYHDYSGSRKGLTIERYFSTAGEDPFESVRYAQKDVKISKPNGEVVFEMSGTEFPEGFRDVDAQIVAQKYFFKPKNPSWKERVKAVVGKEHEYSLKQLIKRTTDFIVEEGWKNGYFSTEEDRDAFSDELKWLQINRRFAFNSPVQFNAGLYHTYGIEGSPSISYYRDPETGKVEKIEDGGNIHPQCHACFIKGPQDNLESIALHALHETGVFSSGSGIGQDIGALRGKNESLSSGGRASGPMSFLIFYDRVAGSVKSGGKSRRAARMTTMDGNHIDILDFIRSKVREDKKALVLMENGYEPGMDGEAVQTVALQNTNLSVRLDGNFFRQLEVGGQIDLINVNDGKVGSRISAERLMREIAFGSWRIGDPAVQYSSKIEEYHTAKNSGRQRSTNPCSEYMFLNDTSCNLNSHNLMEYSDKEGNFDGRGFRRAVMITSIAADIINDAASYPIKDIATISPEFRTIGVGYANLGALLMRKGIPYDSDEGRAFAATITALMTGAAYEASAKMAESLGPFIHFEFNKKPMMEVLEKHKRNLEEISWDLVGDENLRFMTYESWKNVIQEGDRHGFRNAQTTVLAPTGTISYLMGCDTTGVEPGTSLLIYKNLAGGGMIKLVNEEVENALRNLGHKSKEISEIKDYIEKRNTVLGAPHLNPDHYAVFDTAFGNENGEGTIPFMGHVRMLGATQPFISGAISKTNNLPERASVREIYDGYVEGHKLGLKALAVFRNNSKPTSALSLGERGFKKLGRGEKEDLPTRRNAYETEIKIGGTPLHVIVSEYSDGRPGQITFLSFKGGSDLGVILTTAGVQASRALKRGISLEDVAEGWRGHEFEPKGMVTHPYIKTALSPLDFAAKLLLFEYMGDTSVANNTQGLDVSSLRGAINGAFETYRRMKINEWDVDQVLSDPKLGGFSKSEQNANNGSGSPGKNEKTDSESMGITCATCGRMMKRTSPNCYQCGNCGDKIGGCGQ